MIKLNNLKYLRDQARLTQEDVAIKLNIDRSTIAKWETGEAMPRADKLPQLAQVLGCTIDELFHCTADELLEGIPAPK